MVDRRLKKNLDAGGRESRASLDTSREAPEEMFASSVERTKAWKDEWTQRALPETPQIPGFHLCWLSTTNSYDSIDKRMRLGYSPVKDTEVKGMDQNKLKSGEHAGFISCNEMLLYKIPLDLFQEVMQHFHHEAPLEEADKIRQQAEQLGRDRNGKKLGQVEGEGMANFDEYVPTPVFTG
jgi:hypothetical protein